MKAKRRWLHPDILASKCRPSTVPMRFTSLYFVKRFMKQLASPETHLKELIWIAGILSAVANPTN